MFEAARRACNWPPRWMELRSFVVRFMSRLCISSTFCLVGLGGARLDGILYGGGEEKKLCFGCGSTAAKSAAAQAS